MPNDEKIIIQVLCLFELRFRILAPIRKLPHYHGAQWSALLRYALKPYLPAGLSMDKAGVSCIPIETGIDTYEAGEPVHVGFDFPVEHMPAICRMLADFNHLAVGEGHFIPGRTILLESVRNRITDQLYSIENLKSFSVEHAKRDGLFLTEEMVAPEIDSLTKLQQFNIVFYTPLRLNRPEGHKKVKHTFCDEAYFTPSADRPLISLDHFASRTGHIRNGSQQHDATNVVTGLTVSDNSLIFVDIPYGGRDNKWRRISQEKDPVTLGGIVGKLKIAGPPDAGIARRLVMGQYTGVGKNHVFGLGYYTIPELDSVRCVKPFTRGKSLLHRALDVAELKKILDKTKDSSHGPDGLLFSDIKKAGGKYLEKLTSTVLCGGYQAGGFRVIPLPKPEGGVREVHIQNAADRLLQKAVADQMTPVIDNLLSKSSFAYRLGLNRKGAASALNKHLGEGFTTGIKADIAAFFDTVELDRLAGLLQGLFPFDALTDTIIPWLAAANFQGGACLPQGSPLSPVLSNLYLHRFDRDMAQEGFKLIRYADDFVCLFQSGAAVEEDISKIKESLARLGLALKPEKTAAINPGSPIRFLGYNITATDITEEHRENVAENTPWAPVFRETWLSGAPVYLTSICRGAYSSGADLIIKNERQETKNIPWSGISRLIVVGRSPFSGGVVYRAARENIPVSFVDVKGRLMGTLQPSGYDVPELADEQVLRVKDASFCLDFARTIIDAKIHNSHVLLRRNKVDLPELKDIRWKVRQAETLDELMGHEGYAARLYFGEFASLVSPLEFKGRVYHPPDGPVNVLLSFGYTLIYNRIALVLRDRGFNPRIGFFHKGRGGHLSLVSDLMEELRHLVDRVVLALIHNHEITENDFTVAEKKGLRYSRLEGDGFRKYVHRYESIMAATFTAESGEKFTYNTYLEEMAAHLKRSLKMGIPYQPLRID